MDKDWKYISGVIDRIEGDKAVIRLEGDGQIDWPFDKLPAGLKAGSSVRLLAMTDADMDALRQETAKDMLKEILNADD